MTCFKRHCFRISRLFSIFCPFTWRFIKRQKGVIFTYCHPILAVTQQKMRSFNDAARYHGEACGAKQWKSKCAFPLWVQNNSHTSFTVIKIKFLLSFHQLPFLYPFSSLVFLWTFSLLSPLHQSSLSFLPNLLFISALSLFRLSLCHIGFVTFLTPHFASFVLS